MFMQIRANEKNKIHPITMVNYHNMGVHVNHVISTNHVEMQRAR